MVFHGWILVTLVLGSFSFASMRFSLYWFPWKLHFIMQIGQQIVRPAKQGVDRELDFVASLLVIFCLFGTSFLYQWFLLLVFFFLLLDSSYQWIWTLLLLLVLFFCWILLIIEYGLCYCFKKEKKKKAKWPWTWKTITEQNIFKASYLKIIAKDLCRRCHSLPQLLCFGEFALYLSSDQAEWSNGNFSHSNQRSGIVNWCAIFIMTSSSAD